MHTDELYRLGQMKSPSCTQSRLIHSNSAVILSHVTLLAILANIKMLKEEEFSKKQNFSMMLTENKFISEESQPCL